MADETGIFQNKLFLQLLSAAGQDVSQGNPFGTNVSAVTNQAITAENYRQFVMTMLGPKRIPGGTATIDDKGIGFKIPANFFDGFDPMGGGGVMGGGVAPTTPAAPTAPKPTGAGGQVPNPFSFDLSGFSASDLAGLTPAMMESAVGLGIKARTAALATGRDTRTPFQKDYEYAVKGGFEGTPAEWKTIQGDTTNQRDYAAAIKYGYEGSFTDWLVFKAKAGATKINIGDTVKKAKALKEVKDAGYYSTQAFVDDISKDVTSKPGRREVNKLMVANPNMTEERAAEEVTVRSVEKRIISGGRTIKKDASGNNMIRWDAAKRVIIWTVINKSGDEMEIRYVIRP